MIYLRKENRMVDSNLINSSTQPEYPKEVLELMMKNLQKGSGFWDNSQNKLFFLAIFMVVGWFALVFLATKLNIDQDMVEKSFEIVKFVVSAWIGSIIGGKI